MIINSKKIITLLIVTFLVFGQIGFAFAQEKTTPTTKTDTLLSKTNQIDSSSSRSKGTLSKNESDARTAESKEITSTTSSKQVAEIDKRVKEEKDVEPKSALRSSFEEDTGSSKYIHEAYSADLFSVTQVDQSTGVFTYQYDFDLPQVRHAVQPELALTYNSQSQNNVNLAGYGWDISLPYIQRINRKGVDKLYIENYYYSSLDGELVPTNIDNNGYGTYAAKVEKWFV